MTTPLHTLIIPPVLLASRAPQHPSARDVVMLDPPTPGPGARPPYTPKAGTPTAPVTDPDHGIHLESAGRGLARWGSIERWPCLRLEDAQFRYCVCGALRTSHLYAGSDLLGPKNARKCQVFRAPGKAGAK